MTANAQPFIPSMASALVGLLWIFAAAPAVAQTEGYVGDAVCLDCH